MDVPLFIGSGIEKELRELDFLRGDEEYKTRWGAMVRNNFEFRFPKKGFKSRFCNWVFEKDKSAPHEI